MPIDPEIRASDQASTSAAGDAAQELADRMKATDDQVRQAVEDAKKKAQEAADMADFKRQLQDVNAAKAAKTYVVQAGDTLGAIAESQLGSAARWPEIFEANRNILDNPNVIFPGQELKIP